MTTPDISIENHGSIYLFRPLTQPARVWLQDHTDADNSQWFGGALVVEPRYAGDLAHGLITDTTFHITWDQTI